MTPEFKYTIQSTNVDGDKASARFTNARSALMWANRLKEDVIGFTIYKKVSGDSITLSIKELKSEASTEKKPPKRKFR